MSKIRAFRLQVLEARAPSGWVVVGDWHFSVRYAAQDRSQGSCYRRAILNSQTQQAS